MTNQVMPPDEPYESALNDNGKPYQLLRTLSFEVLIDRERCRFSQWDPRGCKQCMKSCPEVIFGASLDERRKTGVMPQLYKLVVIYPELCTGCGGCERVCPHHAITVKSAQPTT